MLEALKGVLPRKSYGSSSQLSGNKSLELKKVQKKERISLTVSSKRSGTLKDGRLVHCSSLLAKGRPGDVYLRLTSNTAKPPKLKGL